ncbi:MAG: polysaccharide biosynthesis tyrosine autokinase [Anaerolineae bacterium]|nr:polysaccharide biosynthesis tyrosine autokinase [Anaerolineae bacterium]
MEASRYFKVLLSRKSIILLTTIIAVAAIWFGTSQMKPVYTAVTKLRVIPLGTNLPDYGTYVYFDRLVSTYSEIIKSEPTLNEARKRLGLAKLPDFRIETIPQTELMRLSVDDNDPQLAMDVCNTLAAILITQNQSLYKADNGGVQSVLKERLNQIEAEINKSIEERSGLLNAVPRDNDRIAELDRAIEARQQTYSLTLASYNQVLVAQSAMANALNIVEPATLPDEPSGPNRNRNVLLGGVAGLMGGIVLAYVMEGVNPRVYTDKQVESTTGSSIIGRIPRIKRAFRKDVFKGDPIAAEAVRRLRTNVFSTAKHARLVLVTSPVAKDGKSTTAVNLARAIARAGQRCLVVDCDTRLPALHTMFGVPNQVGLSNVLREQVSLAEALCETALPELNVLPAGPVLPNSAEVFDSERMTILVGELMNQYEIVILDGPPLLAVTDSAVLAQNASGVLLVVDQARSDQKTIVAAREQLEQVGANLVGVVLNRAPHGSGVNQYKHYARQRR